MIFLAELWITFVLFNTLYAAPPAKCRLGQDLLNGLVNAKNKDADEFGIENTFGLIGNDPGNITDKEDLSSKEFQDCIQQYLQSGPSKLLESGVAPLNLHYEKQPHLGTPVDIPVPVPEDEDYLPGEDGYTTYINPHNFKEKGLFKDEDNKKDKNKKKKKKEKLKNKNKSSEEKFIDELLSIIDDDGEDDDDWL